MTRNYFKSLLLAASLLIAPNAHAAGMIVIDPVTPGMMPVIPTPPPVRTHTVPPTHSTPAPSSVMLHGAVSFGLRLQAADIKVDIADQVAKTYISQTFINNTDRNLAGTYLFPLPDDTTFSSFSLHIDGKPVEGKILEANEARSQYEEIVRRMVDPGLLEYADYKTVRARIFPIPAHGTKKVELEYTQVLQAENGLLKYKFPLKTENETSPADELKVNVKLASKSGIRTIWSPSHTIAVDKKDDHAAKIAYLEKDAVPDKDFLLYYSISDKDLAANLLTHKSSGEDGYYMLTLAPPVETKQIAGKDIVLVADTSGSMEGARMEQNKKALKYLVNALNPGDRFNIIQFNTDVAQLKDNLVQPTEANKKAAMSFIDDMDARGGTNLAGALKTATSMLSTGGGDRPGYLVLMTDGEPTVGDTSVESILKSVNGTRDLRVFDFGVGYDINTRLLNKLAEAHHGVAQYIEPEENIETALSAFYQKIKSPVLSNVKISYEGVQVKDVYPHEVKDIFAGSQVLLIGKYKGSGGARIRLTGTVNGVEKAYSFPLTFAAEQNGNTYLPRLWAMRRIGHLTEVAQENGNEPEVVDEIVALSKKYGIISQYTSFLVTDPAERNAHGTQIGMMPVTRRRAAGLSGGGGARFATDTLAVVPVVPSAPMAEPAAESNRGNSSAAQADVDFGPYMADVQRRIKKQWFPAKGNESKRVVTTFKVNSDGSISDARIDRSSGVALADRAALDAVNKTTMRPLPAGAPQSVDIQFTFDHNVFNGKAPVAFRQFGGNETRDQILKSLSAPTTGKEAVLNQKSLNKLKDVVALGNTREDEIKTAEDKTFLLRDGFWTDTAYDGSQKLETIPFGSKQYFDLLKSDPVLKKYLSVGRQVIFVFKGHGYKITFSESA
jgi:Ca-activated chloride channel family protein